MDDPWDAVDALVAAAETSSGEGDGWARAIESLVLDLVATAASDEIEAARGRLQSAYDRLVRQVPAEYESSRLFLLGRLVAALELVIAVDDAKLPHEVALAMNDSGTIALLQALEHKPLPSKELVASLEMGESTLSRRLDELERLGLVRTDKVQRSRWSTLTPLGEKALAVVPKPVNAHAANSPFWSPGAVSRAVAL